MDIMQMGFIGLVTLGAVNVATFFRKDLKAREKFALSVAVAFVLTFVPVEVGNVIAQKIKEAVEVALAVSGAYKIAQKAGGM